MKYTVETSDSIESFDSLYEAMKYVKTLNTKDYEVYRGGYKTMGNTYTEAQKKATLKYHADKVKIQILVSPDKREKYRELASSRGLSLTQLIVDLLERESSN